MQRVLYSEKNIGIVNPRSNNATVWSVPMDRRFAFKPNDSYKYWLKLKKQIPEKYITPTSHGFCMLIRREIISDIGLFDEIFGKGFGEENDFTLRAKKIGWLSAVANYAYVFHYESRSFGNEQRIKLASENIKIIRKRYPEYESSVREYLEAVHEDIGIDSRLWQYYQLAVKAINYGHYHGYRNMTKKSSGAILNKLKKNNAHLSREPMVQVWAHEITYTGAPTVLFDLLDQWRLKPLQNMRLSYHTPIGTRINATLHEELLEKGYDFIPETPVDVNFVRGDIVILNSSAFPEWLYRKILYSLREERLAHVYFYVHEDSEKIVGATTKFQSLFQDLINDNKVTIYAPSSASLKNWQSFFGVKKNAYVMSGRVKKDEGMLIPKKASDFDKINFIVAGTCEPLKGQISVLNALTYAKSITKKEPELYRDFNVVIAGTKDDGIFYNQFIEKAAQSLGDQITLVNKPTITEMHNHMRDSNFTITYSLSESFSMTTMEGMSYGHPIIRSECSGVEEQLVVGANGFLARTTDFSELVDTVETVLNKEKTSNIKLAEMSKKSVMIARRNIEGRYRLIDDIAKDIN